MTQEAQQSAAQQSAAQQPRLSKKQYQLCLYVEQYYYRYGVICTFANLEADIGPDVCTKEEWEATWQSELAQQALRARGLPEHLLTHLSAAPGTKPDPFAGKTLTEQQLAVANVMLDILDTRSRIKKLTEMGISTQTYNMWLRDPVYRQYCMDRAETMLVENQPVAHMSLINRVTQGDLGAVKYFNALTGRYREASQAHSIANANVTVNQFGTPQLIAIVEIIQRHVKDPATLEAIGGEILALNNGPLNNGGNNPGPDALERAHNRLTPGAGQAVLSGLSEPLKNEPGLSGLPVYAGELYSSRADSDGRNT